MTALSRIALVHGPTPIQKRRGLDEILGVDLWIKRDDATGGAEAGNKIRKLEWLLGDAVARRADTVVTCGGLQSNHARATALVCASLGLACVLLLRVPDPLGTPLPRDGNVLLDRLAGAEIRLISHAEYARRGAVMESVSIELTDRGKRPYIVPEGGSNGLGALGYVECMREIAAQIGCGGRPRGVPVQGGRERPGDGRERRRRVLREDRRADRAGSAVLGPVARRSGPHRH